LNNIEKNPAEPAEPVRRNPKQARALATKEAIFEATVQLLEGEGEAAFNTNRIAQRAGVSIGTLYQYFSRKEDILIELAMRESIKHRTNNARLNSEFEAGALTMDEVVRASTRSYINQMKGAPATRRMALKVIRDEATAVQMGRGANTTSNLLPALKGGTRTMRKTDAFILSRAIMGTVQAAVLEDYKGLYGKAFEDGIVRLVEGYSEGS
jgi:AcrR family transcriptional regulator